MTTPDLRAAAQDEARQLAIEFGLPGELSQSGLQCEKLARLIAHVRAAPSASHAFIPDVDDLAQEIRRLDGAHFLGAGRLAEGLVEWMQAAAPSAVAAEDARATLAYQIESEMTLAADCASAFYEDAQVVPVDAIRAVLGATPHHAPAVAETADEAFERGRLHGVEEESLFRAVSAGRAPGVAAEAGQGELAQSIASVMNMESSFAASFPETTQVVPVHLIRTALSATQPAPPSQGQTAAARDVLAERQRQISDLGWTSEHDDEHDSGELSAAAGSYAIAAADVLHPQSQGDGGFIDMPPLSWPWDGSWWRPGVDPRRMLVKAGALILAEIERLDRAAPTQPPAEGGE